MDDPGSDPAVTRMVIVLPLEDNNTELHALVIKEVRKPGHNFEAIIRLLGEVKGPLDMQRYIIHYAIKEAARFKKWVLIQQLELAPVKMEESLRGGETLGYARLEEWIGEWEREEAREQPRLSGSSRTRTGMRRWWGSA